MFSHSSHWKILFSRQTAMNSSSFFFLLLFQSTYLWPCQPLNFFKFRNFSINNFTCWWAFDFGLQKWDVVCGYLYKFFFQHLIVCPSIMPNMFIFKINAIVWPKETTAVPFCIRSSTLHIVKSNLCSKLSILL